MKKVKMCIYGEPGTGKSVFASKTPKPFFITTDGNYEWLEDFGAKEEDHVQVFSWAEAKKVFDNDFNGYETIVVDLIEDLFKWCEQEYCQRSKIDHVSDIGYGKGYEITRNEFFLEVSKLLGKDKNIILISHGYSYKVKDRKGIEHTKYTPSNRIPDKVWDMIEGRTRYFLRAYMTTEIDKDENIQKVRRLSIIPKENEFGIARGINEAITPSDIDLDWLEFAKYIGYNNIQVQEKRSVEPVKNESKQEEIIHESVEPIKESVEERTTDEMTQDENVSHETSEKQETENVSRETLNETNTVESVESVKEELSNEDKLAAIRAKLAAMKANKGE